MFLHFPLDDATTIFAPLFLTLKTYFDSLTSIVIALALNTRACL